MNFKSLNQYITQYKKGGKEYFITSSFQSHSLVLLHMLSRIDPRLPVIFINTGYHFPETIKFRDEIMNAFGMDNLIDLKSSMPKSMQMDAGGRLLFTSDPDHCCYINKTQPLDSILRTHDVWINGVRADQSATRSQMKETQQAPHNTIRLHPMLDWTSKMVYEYQKEYNLPKHPLDTQGYMSIGCEPCTRRINPEMQEREARWYGLNKTECGLHTDLIKQ
ncbi:MAG: phosphoadenylyl-sulfate reductase [Cyclobacteriaceae bacterium]|nr:phosphoadenylyl-sulfate reductase [Cyclobacteriaceae bacterium]